MASTFSFLSFINLGAVDVFCTLTILLHGQQIRGRGGLGGTSTPRNIYASNLVFFFISCMHSMNTYEVSQVLLDISLCLTVIQTKFLRSTLYCAIFVVSDLKVLYFELSHRKCVQHTLTVSHFELSKVNVRKFCRVYKIMQL